MDKVPDKAPDKGEVPSPNHYPELDLDPYLLSVLR
jgi:hypothetical protein